MRTRSYNSLEIKLDDGIIIKTSKTERLYDEINYYLSIPDHLKIYFPRVVEFNDYVPPYFLKLEYYSYKDLDKYFIEPSTLKAIRNITLKFKEVKSKQTNTKECRQKMFIDKTLNEYNNLKKNNEFFENLGTKLLLNDDEFYNFEEIWPQIEVLINKILLNSLPFSMIHGDLCLSNILWSGHLIKFIDMRGSFGVKGIFGDEIYDKAKLSHSIRGRYEDIIHDRFLVDYNTNLINHQFVDESAAQISCNYESFEDIFGIKDTDRIKVKLLEGLIFIGMCDRHSDSFNRQLVMYSTGIRYLNEVLKEA